MTSWSRSFAAALLAVADFETGDLSQLQTQAARPDSLTVVTSPVRAGKYAVKCLLRATDPEVSRGRRSEFQDGKTPIAMEQEYWYGLSILVPPEFVAPEKTNAVLFQWHTQDRKASPVLSVRVQGAEWVLSSTIHGQRHTLGRLPLEKGKWTDWVVHVKWTASPTGFWTIWKDGREVVRETNIPTQLAEAAGPYVKFGQYHSVDETPQNIIYVDEYRVAGTSGNYQEVAPGGVAMKMP